MNNLVNEIHESLIRLGDICGCRTMNTDKVIMYLDRKNDNRGIEIISDMMVKVFYWQHKGKTELRVKDNLVAYYENIGRLDAMRNECQVLNDLINEYVGI